MKHIKTRFIDIRRPDCEMREHTRSSTRSRFGRSYCLIACPFCQSEVVAYIWSLAGGGKRCPCGAIHSSQGSTYKLRPAGDCNNIPNPV